MLTVWLYLIGALAACGYAIGATMGWVPSSTPLAAACLGIALTFVLTAEFANRRTSARSRTHAARGTDARLASAERDYRTLIDSIDDIVFETDTDASLTFLSHAWKTVTMLEVHACLQTPLFRYIHPDDQALNREQFLTLLSNSGTTCRYETRLICRDGQQCWVEMQLKPQTDRRGAVIGVVGLMSNIHSRKRAEDVLRARDRGLSTLLDHLPGMAFRCRNDRSWTMEFVSDGCFDLTGYEAVDLLNQPSYEKLIHADDRRYVWDYVQSQLAQGKAYHLRYRLRTREGREKWVDERGRGVFAGDGTLLAIEGFVSDISSQKREEERVEREPLRDTLTGLKSRALLADRITFAIESGQPFALLCIDIDNLKRINERHGRAVGDTLLRGIGARLAQLCDNGMTAARCGGDEFAILMPLDIAPPHAGWTPAMTHFAAAVQPDPHAAGILHGLALTDILADMLDTPFDVNGIPISVSARIGIALGSEARREAGTALREALHAAYSAQWRNASGSVRYAFASDAARQSALAWRHSAGEFARGFDDRKLSVGLAHVRPVAGGTGWTEGSVHWNSPRIGIVPPVHLFIHAAAAGTLEALVETCTRIICEQVTPRLQPGERLCLCLDAVAPSMELLRGALRALQTEDAKALPAAGCDLLIGLPTIPDAHPLHADIVQLRRDGIRLGVDITIAVNADTIALPDWLLLADYWRVRLDAIGNPADTTPNRLNALLETAASRGIPVVAAGGITPAVAGLAFAYAADPAQQLDVTP